MCSLCSCRYRAPSPRERDQEPLKENLDGPLLPRAAAAAPIAAAPSTAQGGEAERVADPPSEGKICPVTGAVGYCPMARPKGGRKPGEQLPELRVLMLLVWEEQGSKVSIGVYPHMNRHWEALELPDSAKKDEIRAQFRKLSVRYHPDKNREEGATERFQKIQEAYEALKETDGELAFPWDKHPEKQQVMTGAEALRAFGPLAAEAAQTDPIKAQMMQHVVRESTECKVLILERDTSADGRTKKEIWCDGLCVDERNGSNHLVKIYRCIFSGAQGTAVEGGLSADKEAMAAAVAEMDMIDEN